MITNRTQADVNNIDLSKEYVSKGAYNCTDLNRVETKVKELNTLLTKFGYMTTLTTKLDWTLTDKFTVADGTRYLNNIKALRNVLNVPSGTPTAPSSMANLTYTRANNIEKILVAIEGLVQSMMNRFVHSGVSRSGQTRNWQNRFRHFYTEKNYITSTGTQYIDTGYFANNNTRVEAKVVPIGVSSGEDWQCVFSSKTKYRINEFVVQIVKETNNWYSAYGTNVNTFYSVSDYTVYTIDKNKNVTTINASTDTLPSETFTATQTGYIFADNERGATHFFKGRLYYLRIYDNDILVRDYVPAVDGDGIVGLYERIGQQFYYNQGSGVFTAG